MKLFLHSHVELFITADGKSAVAKIFLQQKSGQSKKVLATGTPALNYELALAGAMETAAKKIRAGKFNLTLDSSA